MTDTNSTAPALTLYAAIGTDGRDPVVWGVGSTTHEAVADAEAQEVDCGPLCTMEITAEQRDRIDAGEVSCAALGLTLSASDVRAITR